MRQFHKTITGLRTAFTLLELCAALGLIATLATITWSCYAASMHTRNLQQAKLQCAVLSSALESYQLQNGNYPAELNELINPQGRAYLDAGAVGLDACTFNDPWGRAWIYTLGGNAYAKGYHLVSAGLDGRLAADSLDDIAATY